MTKLAEKGQEIGQRRQEKVRCTGRGRIGEVGQGMVSGRHRRDSRRRGGQATAGQ